MRRKRKDMQFLAWVLCSLGLHQPLVTHPGHRQFGERDISALGYCGRCNEPYQWDV